jgi:hypothetical protein
MVDETKTTISKLDVAQRQLQRLFCLVYRRRPRVDSHAGICGI